MKKALLAICAISLLLANACEDTPESSPSATTTDPTKIIAETDIDYDRNGVMEKLYVRMVTGQLKEETEPGPYLGTYWEGEFRLELVSKEGTLLHELDLNSTFGSEPLIFVQNRDFKISFEDYNNDGYPDFSIGQYFSSNGFTYNLYSLMPKGIAVIHRDLFTADSKYSILYEKAGNTSFKNSYYDMEKGTTEETLFTWQGERFVRTECEGCGLTPEKATGGEFDDLQLSVEITGDGFRLAHGDGDGFYMAQTLISPPIEGTSYAVHIIRTNSGGDKEVNFKRDAVVVNPVTAAFRIFPLYNAVVDDMYGADSIAVAYGFLDDRHLVYVSVVNDVNRAEGYYYRVEKMNIVTGETTIVLPEIPDVLTTEHFAPGWLNDNKDTLVLNSYGTGQLWSINLLKGEIIRPQASFSHSWPFYLTVASPDGERFWYTDYAKNEYRLYDNTGRLQSKTAFGKGYDQYPAFLWSPDSRYAANQDTRDQGAEHVINDDGETYIIAPQRIRFFDRQGSKIRTVQTGYGSGKYIEIAGWLDDADGVILLHEYELERGKQSEPAKINSHYRLLNLKSGETHALQIAPDLTQVIDSVPARTSRSYSIGADRRIYRVNTKRMQLMILSEDGSWLSEPGEKRDDWVSNGYGAEASAFHEFNPNTGQIREKELGVDIVDIQSIGTDWLVSGDMWYTRL